MKLRYAHLLCVLVLASLAPLPVGAQSTLPPLKQQVAVPYPTQAPPVAQPMPPPQAQIQPPPMQPQPMPTQPLTPAQPTDKSLDPPEIIGGPETPAPFDWSKFRLGGQYRINANSHNFNYHPNTITNDQQSRSLVLQRFRLWLTYNPNENVEGYIQMQVGQLPWNGNFDFNHNFVGTFIGVGGDRVGVELRRAWLAYKHDDLGRTRAGFLDWHDSFSDTLASADYDFNVPGVEWTHTSPLLNDAKLKAAALLLTDAAFVNLGTGLPSHRSAGMFTFDVDQAASDRLTYGASSYLIIDRGGYSYPTLVYNQSWDYWFGVRAKVDTGIAPINGFFLVNTGERNDFNSTFRHTGFAALGQIGAVPIGPGKFFSQAVYASGDSNPGTGTTGREFRTPAQSVRDNFGSQGYWSYMQLTSPNGPGDIADLGIGLQNRGYGLFTVQGKYEMPLCRWLTSTSAVGWFRSDRPNLVSNSTDIGTELFQMFTIDFTGNLKLDFGAAVLFTGDFYRTGVNDPRPNNLYEAFARLQLEF